MTALVCVGLFCVQGAELTWNQSAGASIIFHAYAKPMPAPEFSLEDLQGKTVDMRQLRGQVILLNFWATWCPNCRKESTSFEKLSTQYGPKGLILFRINSKESRESVEEYVGKESLHVPVLLDKTGKVGRLFGIWAHPTSYLIDRQGMVRYRAVGPVDWTGPEALSVINHLLKER
jgi:peroxiredoxin